MCSGTQPGVSPITRSCGDPIVTLVTAPWSGFLLVGQVIFPGPCGSPHGPEKITPSTAGFVSMGVPLLTAAHTPSPLHALLPGLTTLPGPPGTATPSPVRGARVVPEPEEAV